MANRQQYLLPQSLLFSAISSTQRSTNETQTILQTKLTTLPEICYISVENIANRQRAIFE